MNNGNVTRAAVGVAERLWGRLESILKRFVLWVKHGPFWLTWGQESFTGKTWGQARAGEGRQGRQARAGEAGQARQGRRGRAGRAGEAGQAGQARQGRQAGGKRKAPGG